MSEAPKLYTNKPKKVQLKQFQEQNKGKDFASPTPSSSASSGASAAAASYKMGPGYSAPPSPPPPPKESFARRYKFLWPLLLAVNFAVGAYLFMRTKSKDTTEEETGKDVPATPALTTAATTAPITETPLHPPLIAEAARLREPIPMDQQRELFKWILEEKRKVKPKDPQEKKRIDEEKAILKQFIRAKSIPTL